MQEDFLNLKAPQILQQEAQHRKTSCFIVATHNWFMTMMN